MTPEERSRVQALVVVPAGRAPLPPAEFLREFGAADGVQLGLDLLADAIDRRDPVDVELALVVCFTFGFSGDHVQPLITLAFADWHQRHEDVALALEELKAPASVDALAHLARWVPDYLSYNDGQALATKAIWGLGKIGNDAARAALTSLARSPRGVVAEGATAQLAKLG